MRNNQPVTQRERPFPKGATLMSTTDPQSRITYANAAFTQISGFTQEELLGQPHNLVRHPDVPPRLLPTCGAPCNRATAGRRW
jgi:aerotaxis receptor